MKKIILAVCLMIGISFMNGTFAQKKAIKALSLIPDIEVVYGQNQYVEGKWCPCCQGGICKIKIGRMVQTAPREVKDISLKNPVIAFDDVGNIYLVANDGNERSEYYDPFQITAGVSIDEESLLIINNAVKAVVPTATPFTGVEKGKTLVPFKVEHLQLIQIN